MGIPLSIELIGSIPDNPANCQPPLPLPFRKKPRNGVFSRPAAIATRRSFIWAKGAEKAARGPVDWI
jgi:hypothetical protein